MTTELHSIRVDHETWERWQTEAAVRGITVTDLIKIAIAATIDYDEE